MAAWFGGAGEDRRSRAVQVAPPAEEPCATHVSRFRSGREGEAAQRPCRVLRRLCAGGGTLAARLCVSSRLGTKRKGMDATP
jgi:hypothetical protein